MNCELLNKVQALVIETANSQNIDLRQHFKTVDKFKDFIIALCIKTMIDGGVPADKAFDAVMGDGAFVKLADSAWETLQASPEAA